MQLTKNFALAEFERSDTALRLGLPNKVPPYLMATMAETAQVMQRIRGALGHSITITSGYRCEQVNRAVGSSASSDHLSAKAVDFRCPDFGDPVQVATALAPHISALGIGQLICEFGSHGWVHASTKVPANPVNRIISIDRLGVRAGVHDGR